MRRHWFLSILLLIVFVPGIALAEFSRDLYFGLRSDPDVVRLQEFLRERGFFTYPQSTGNFFGVTRAAVRQFQVAYDIVPTAGYFGPRSRAVANQLLTGGMPAPLSSAATTSPYKGKIMMTSLRGTSKAAGDEQVTLANKSTSETISITGFRIQNSRGGTFALPKGHELPGSVAVANDPIRLRPGDQAVITLGKQERQMNFRENLCTGYFDESSRFSPALSRRCPQVEPRDFPRLSDRCVQRLEATPICRTFQTDQFTDSGCAEFGQAHYTYDGCVRDNRDRPDFYATRWLVWMQRDTEFFGNFRDRVTVFDTEGKAVDERSY